MSIYLGDSGFIELERESLNVPLHSVLDPDDVNVDRKRFSFDFPPTSLITGDKLNISTADGSNLQLVAGHNFPDGHWYINIDAAGGIRLYDEYADALTGDFGASLALLAPSSPQDIVVRTADTVFRCIAQVRDYSFTTSRETLDLTQIGEEFRRNYADGLIAGQGELTCFWDFQRSFCDDRVGLSNELPNYFAQLILRTQLGSSFLGRFFLKRPENDTDLDYLWWEARCVVTNVSMQFAAGQPVLSQIAFVASEEFRLKFGRPPSHLLQEDGNRILQEDGTGILLDTD